MPVRLKIEYHILNPQISQITRITLINKICAYWPIQGNMHEFPVYLDNIIFSLQRAGGISVYWFELVNRLASSTDRLVAFEHGATANNLFSNKLTNDIAIRRERKLLPDKVVRYLPLKACLEEPSIFHSSYYRISIQKNVANIVTVYDFIYERFRRGLSRIVHSWQKRFVLNLADGIICISESTKKDLLSYFPELGKKDIKVIYLGVSDAFRVLSGTTAVDRKIREIISTKYVVFVGARTAYKNFDVAVDVVSGMTDCRLLIVGGGELSYREISRLKEKLADRFWHCQSVDYTLLNIFYNNAFCLLYPSGYEGFGIPIIEAMSAGCPVVAVNVSSIPEACGHAGLLVNKPNSGDLIEKIKMLENASFRKEMIRKGRKDAGRFSWDECHLQTKEFYNKVFQEKFGIPFRQ